MSINVKIREGRMKTFFVLIAAAVIAVIPHPQDTTV